MMKKTWIVVALFLALLMTSCMGQNKVENNQMSQGNKAEVGSDERQDTSDMQEEDDNKGSASDEREEETNESDSDQSGEQASGNTQTDDEQSGSGKSDTSVIVLPKDHF